MTKEWQGNKSGHFRNLFDFNRFQTVRNIRTEYGEGAIIKGSIQEMTLIFQGG